MKLVHAQSQLAGKTRRGQFAQHCFQLAEFLEPDAVGHDLVEAKTQFGGATAHGVHKLGIEEWFAPGEAQSAYSVGMGVL